jgi:hypothetical protein
MRFILLTGRWFDGQSTTDVLVNVAHIQYIFDAEKDGKARICFAGEEDTSPPVITGLTTADLARVLETPWDGVLDLRS